MASKKDIEKDVPEQPPKKKSRILVLLIIAIAAVVAGAIVMTTVLYFVGIPGVAPKMKGEAPPVYQTLDLGERVVNLADAGGGRYLKVKIVLEHKKDEKLAAELKEKEAPVMETIINVLRSKKINDVMPLENAEKVKGEILTKVNSKLESGKIERIYFTDFLIQ